MSGFNATAWGRLGFSPAQDPNPSPPGGGPPMVEYGGAAYDAAPAALEAAAEPHPTPNVPPPPVDGSAAPI